MKVIMIAGKANSGKSEVSKLINEHYIYKHERCIITGFAKYIKNFVMEFTSWDGNELTTPMKDFQQIGKEIRDINPEYLINNMLQDLTIYENFCDVLVIEDTRFPFEIDTLKNSFDEVYSVHVENQFMVTDLNIEEQIDITEVALENYPDFDHNIVNDDLKILRDKVFKIMEVIDETAKL